MKLISKLLFVLLSALLFYSCKEKPTIPILTTGTATNVTTRTAVAGGEIIDDGGATIIAQGVCWNVSTNPTIENSKSTENPTSKSFTSNLSNLAPSTLYYLRAYATNSIGTGYGETVSFTTLGQAPSVITLPASNVQVNTVTLNGSVNPNNLSTTFTFEYGTANYGNNISFQQNLPANYVSQNVSVDISGLSSGTTYYFRINAKNEFGTTHGDFLTFTTLDEPILSTHLISKTTTNSASSGGVITSDFGSPILERGICWNTSSNPTILDNKIVSNSSSADFSVDITGLTPNTTYYLRAYATNGAGTGYGDVQTFKTFTGTISDVDGNNYYTVTIGTQIWMAENLRTTHYRNGDPIPNIKDNAQWYNLVGGAYCYYNNDSTVPTILGLLYNWYTTADSRNLCPTGWHVSTDDEWTILVNYLGGMDIGGGKMKLPGLSYWMYPNTGADNSSGFNGISGGLRGIDGNFFKGPGAFWTSTSENITNARNWFLMWNDASAKRYYDKKIDGFNVRCLKD